jgi:adenine-specific DNA-methyltransferase
MKLYATLVSVLKSETNTDFQLQLLDNQGDLMLNKIHDLVDKTDENLIGLLLENKDLREKFFFKVKEVYVFKTNDFKFFLDENKIDNSYTQYENRIGLTVGGKFLKDSADVVLDFPYKDCILEGGQSTEEGTDTYFEYNPKDEHYIEKQAKRKEIFFNSVLAKDEIDRLLEPKAFSNIKKHTINGEESITSFERDEKGTIKDNLIIKGNNLLALHTLKSEFAGKVKLIYIDPPYNTGSDSFAYNDNFNHSTWLTFMRNRLLVAKELLGEDGVMLVQCDDNEQAYLKVLLDEIFGTSNFVETFIWKNTDNAPTLSKKSRKNIEFIHCYEKSSNPSKGFIGRESDNDDAPLLNSGNPITTLEFCVGIISFKIPDGLYKKNNFDKIELLDDLIIEDGKNKNVIRLKGRFKWQQSFLNEEIKNGTYFLIKSNIFSIRYQRKTASNIAPDKLLDESYLSKAIGVETNEDSKKHIDSLKLEFNSYPKPETLIGFLINAVTDENEFVLDFYLGSGTTAATAHKINRRYIGIEQMDYIETVAVERLKKVIDGEQGGVSKSVNWQGGGSFVYLELAKNNQNAIEHIQSCESHNDLVNYFDVMCDTYF